MAFFAKLQQFPWYKDRNQYAYRVPETPGSSQRSPSEEKGSEDGLLEEMQYHAFATRRPLWKNGRFMIISHILLFTLYIASLIALWESKNTDHIRAAGMPFCKYRLYFSSFLNPHDFPHISLSNWLRG